MNASSDTFDASTYATTARALSGATRRLHELWRAERDPQARADLAVAATLSAHAALDALIPDATRGRRTREHWRGGSVLVRAARVTATHDRPLPPDLQELCVVRHALGRSGEGAGSTRARAWVEGDGVERAVSLIDTFERLCASRAH